MPLRCGLVSSLLSAIENDIKLSNGMDNGDVLQAIAMALAIRARMIHAPHESQRNRSRSALNNSKCRRKNPHDRAEAGQPEAVTLAQNL